MRVDLSCDVCGESYDPTAVVWHSRSKLWAAAYADGWVVVSSSAMSSSLAGRHRCPACAIDADHTSAALL